MQKVLFVCTGNTCRSPMAQGLAQMKMGKKWGDKVIFDSAGTFALNGQEASPLAVEVLSEIGIDLKGHRAKKLSKGLIESASLIVAMAPSHLDAVLALDPGAESKVILPNDLYMDREISEVEDPLGGDREVYLRVRDELDYLTDRLKSYLERGFEAGGG